MMLIKLKAGRAQREEIKRLVDIFRGKIIDVTESSYIIELTGMQTSSMRLLKRSTGDLVVEVVRTGLSGIARAPRACPSDGVILNRQAIQHSAMTVQAAPK